MDFVEINKATQRRRADAALDHLYELCDLTKEESMILVLYACKKQYGVMKTAKICHGLGVKKLDLFV